MHEPFPRGTSTCACDVDHLSPALIALTGGPGAGKTAVIELARRAFCRHVVFLPEAAGLIFKGGFPRLPSEAGRCAVQRAIFHVQRELQGLVASQDGVALAVCDRGTIDGLAYWPGEPERYWRELATSRETELGRYQAVVHLRTPSPALGYTQDNPLRIESAEQAARIDQRIQSAWQSHPRYHVIEAKPNFEDKAHHALELLRGELRRALTPGAGMRTPRPKA